jgi:hypothetical protein
MAGGVVVAPPRLLTSNTMNGQTKTGFKSLYFVIEAIEGEGNHEGVLHVTLRRVVKLKEIEEG